MMMASIMVTTMMPMAAVIASTMVASVMMTSSIPVIIAAMSAIDV